MNPKATGILLVVRGPEAFDGVIVATASLTDGTRYCATLKVVQGRARWQFSPVPALPPMVPRHTLDIIAVPFGSGADIKVTNRGVRVQRSDKGAEPKAANHGTACYHAFVEEYQVRKKSPSPCCLPDWLTYARPPMVP